MLAAAIVALCLGAPWMAELAECRAPGCADEASFSEPRARWADAGTAPCACPAGCAAAPGGGCTASDGAARESIVGRRSQGIRGGQKEPCAQSPVDLLNPAGAAPASAHGQLARWVSSSKTGSTPLFIVHRSILR
jgi:hypothetical protein